MRKLVWGTLVLAVAILGAGWLARRSESPAPVPVARSAPAEPAPAVVERPAPRGRPALAPDAALLATARELLGAGGREELCGPYLLYTDVTDARLIAACGRLAARLDGLYEERYGLRPLGEPAEAIVLFAEIDGYRALAREGAVPLGYAGYAVAARGLAVFYAGDQPLAAFLSTLAHELTHLVSRRALGINLPPWLSEGLADGIGDTATVEGFRPLAGVAGSEVQAGRLREAYESGRAGSLERLVALKRGEFDRAAVSFDYEQSALFVRFLLSEPELASGFRSFLRGIAQGEAHAPERLSRALAVGWEELDRRFEAWVRTALRQSTVPRLNPDPGRRSRPAGAGARRARGRA